MPTRSVCSMLHCLIALQRQRRSSRRISRTAELQTAMTSPPKYASACIAWSRWKKLFHAADSFRRFVSPTFWSLWQSSCPRDVNLRILWGGQAVHLSHTLQAVSWPTPLWHVCSTPELTTLSPRQNTEFQSVLECTHVGPWLQS